MKVLIVAGGTGGHLYPGIAIGRVLKGQDVQFAVRRGDMGRDILQKEGFAVNEIAGQGLPRTFSLRFFTFPVAFLRGWLEAWLLLRRFRPDWVIGMGGYLSAPVILLAHLLGIKTFLHEQNAFPGLANRLLSRWADSVAVSFPASLAHFNTTKTWVSGLPVRPDIGLIDQEAGRDRFGLDRTKPTFLVFGGSLGAQRLNSIVAEAWPFLLKTGLAFQVIHITGTKDFERVGALYKSLNVSAKVLPYCHSMPDAYAAADTVVCRAGASTVAELLAARRPALLIPYPYATNNHQVYNAEVIVKNHLGDMILEADLQPAMIADYLVKTVTETFKRDFEAAMSSFPADASPQEAAARIAAHLK